MELSHFFGRHLSMWHSTKRCSSIFDLDLLRPKIYSPKLALGHWFSHSLYGCVSWQHRAICAHKDLHVGGADPCCRGNEIWARRGV